MDAVLKHLGLRSDFIVCHPDVIDDLLFHAPRPLPTHPPTHILSCNPLLLPSPPLTHTPHPSSLAAFCAFYWEV